ncbi:MAG: HD domain-containing protein [Eubacteriales bacterium]|nr:HD domain-containing protein [Eubacteriales bacterium]
MDITVADDISAEYLGLVRSILANPEFRKLQRYTQHYQTTRFMHSLNVSYISWLIARKFGLDANAAARAGLLHDFCVYDFKDKLPDGEIQAFYHPRVAAWNSAEYFDISEKEYQAILSHMFPLGPIPRSREAWVISLADKLCAVSEFCCFRIALCRKHRVMISYG